MHRNLITMWCYGIFFAVCFMSNSPARAQSQVMVEPVPSARDSLRGVKAITVEVEDMTAESPAEPSREQLLTQVKASLQAAGIKFATPEQKGYSGFLMVRVVTKKIEGASIYTVWIQVAFEQVVKTNSNPQKMILGKTWESNGLSPIGTKIYPEAISLAVGEKIGLFINDYIAANADTIFHE